MELRVLEYFLALAREGSVSAAARALHVSQPALSRQLIDLERELGTTLFERGRHGIALTEDGTLLRRRASEIVGLARITQNEIQLNHGVIEGEVRIGCAETRAVDLIARLMMELRRSHPRVTFTVQSGVAEDVAERVGHGLLDFGLLLRVRENWGLEALRLPSSERAVLLMRADDPLAGRRSVAFDDLLDTPLLLPSTWAAGGLLGTERPRDEGGRLDVAAMFDLPYSAMRMVLAGMGCAVMLDGLVCTSPESGLAAVPLDIDLDMPSYLAWKPSPYRTRACEAFLDLARATYDPGAAADGTSGRCAEVPEGIGHQRSPRVPEAR